MTLLTAEEARRSDGGEAMSTGSELSEEGSDVVFLHSSSLAPVSPTSPVCGDLGSSYDRSVAHILELHRALAQSYSTGGKGSHHHTMGTSPKSHTVAGATSPCKNVNGVKPEVCDDRRRPRTMRALSADLGCLRSCQHHFTNHQHHLNQHHQQCQYPPQHHLNQSWGSTGETPPEPSTPTSLTPSDTSSTASGSGTASTSGGTPRGKNLKFNLSTISENIGLLMRRDRRGSATNAPNGNGSADSDFPPMRVRSQSACVPAHAAALWANSDGEYATDDDEDDDDYGFLSHYSGLFLTPQRLPSSSANGGSDGGTNDNALPSGMHKSKSPAAPRRLLPKRWRKPKWTPSKEPPVPWIPEGSCTWSSGNGRKVTLTTTSLVNLSNVERLALQKISLAKIQAMDLGCAITIPKDGSSNKRSKRTFSLKRKTNSDSSSGWVFGIPLSKVTANDLELRRRKPSSLRERRESLDLPQRHTRKSSSSSVSHSSQLSCQQSLVSLSVSSSLELLKSFNLPTGAMSSDSLSETDSRSTGGAGSTQGSTQGSVQGVGSVQGSQQGSVQGTNLLDALSLSSSAKLESSWRDARESLTPHTPVVPYLVNACCKHLETYGLNVLGIFRIGSSKKRIKQLRDEFDSGRDVKLNEDHNPHDVGALLKVFFRDLPDPLLTRDLYNAFLATRKLGDDNRRVRALCLLVALLPAVSRDTLWALLTFLALVVTHSADTVDDHGNKVPGNKMDAHNLATLFGPNILHKAKGGEFEVTSVEHAEERHDVISVVKEMIEQHRRLFEAPAELHDEVIRLLMETNPESADYLLRRKFAMSGIEADPETSSSFYEESDSIPRSASYSSENNDNPQGPGSRGAPSRGRDQVDGLNRGSRSSSSMDSRVAHMSRSSRSQYHTHHNNRAADPPPPLEMLKIPQFRISSPEQGWYRPDSRSPSPMSPRISPSPKAMKAATPNLRIRILPDTPSAPHRERSSSTNSLIMPRPVRFHSRQHLSITTSSSIPSSGAAAISSGGHAASSHHMLTVPSAGALYGLKRDRDSDSCSSQSSYYPSTSRSATNSPITPDAPHSWGAPMDTPPASPRSPPGGPCPEARTSSRQRPLGVNLHVQTASPRHLRTSSAGEDGRSRGSGQSTEWQKQRWKRWEMIAKEHSDDFYEQETLV